MTYNLRLATILTFGLLLFLWVGCKGTSKAEGSKIKKRSAAFLQKKMLENQVNAEWLSSNVKIVYRDNSQIQKVTALVKIKKDSILWMSIRKFGLEGARVQITQDSVFLIDRLNGQYAIKDLDYIQQEFNLPSNFNMLQALFLGNPIFFTKELEAEPKTLSYYLIGDAERFKSEYWLNSSTYDLKKIAFFDKDEKMNLEINLENYQILPNKQKFSYFRTLELKTPEIEHLSIDLTFSKTEINVPKNIHFEIPKRYTRID